MSLRRLSVAFTLAALAACSRDSGREEQPPRPPPGRLDPASIPKFVTPLVIPPPMPAAAIPVGAPTPLPDAYYEVEAVQFPQQVLPAPLPMTTVWGYGKVGDPATRHSPGFTFEVQRDEVVRVKWVNGLVDDGGRYRPHLFAVDDTLHWANPSGAMDMTGVPYTGPVPIVTHVHGAHVADHSDGNPDAWYLPAAADLPPGYALQGPFGAFGIADGPGFALFQYTNDQPAATLWYHDHALGITRLNVMAGLAGFWLVRDPAEALVQLPGGAQELPLAIQDRTFLEDGSLHYPKARAEFDGFEGPYMPTPGAMAPPIWNPEFFGDAMMVNGRTWPYHEVERLPHRLRLLNGCNARFLKLRLSDGAGGWLPFQQVGSDQGLLPAAVTTEEVLLGPGERADVLVDFSGLAVGARVTLVNVGPDEPYKGPAEWLPPADPATTGLVMEFRVIAAVATPPAIALANLPATPPPDPTGLTERELTLNEIMDMEADVPVAAELGTATDGPLAWVEAATETPALGATEIWRVVNLTADAHPIHLHLVRFQVLDRTPLDVDAYRAAYEAHLAVPGVWPAPDAAAFVPGGAFGAVHEGVLEEEKGWKDTVLANPGEVTRLVATFDLAGTYVWHCHILEHEDNEMMRPLVVLPP
jgi:FtsP/CotA-like multicopper oxidase with cupredoxin domain